MKVPAHSADGISSCAILLAGVVGGVLVFVVALPLALSSPFPTPRQGEWVIKNSAFDEVSSLRALPMRPLPMERLRVDLPLKAPASPSAQQPEPITFAERWSPTVPETAAIAAPVANEAHSVEVPAEAARLAPLGKAVEVTPRGQASSFLHSVAARTIRLARATRKEHSTPRTAGRIYK